MQDNKINYTQRRTHDQDRASMINDKDLNDSPLGGEDVEIEDGEGWSGRLTGRRPGGLRGTAKIGENRLIGPELVQETTDKVILIKERLKVARDCQNSYVGNMRKQLGFEVGDKVILEVSSWKGVKYLADVNLRMPVEEIKVDKTLRFVEEPVEIIDREVKSLKRSRILIVKVHWNSKRGHEDFMKTSIHACSMSNLLLEVLIKVGYIGLLADFSAPLNVLSDTYGIDLGLDEYTYSVLVMVPWDRIGEHSEAKDVNLRG
ncbi:hypothetical protein Tco_0517778 [Tanacetum coccineum]